MSKLISKSSTSLSALLVVASMVGCADSESLDDVNPEVAVDRQTTHHDALAQTRGGKATITSVTATGSGCPKGSWEEDVSEDGEVFTLTFSKYEIEVQPNAGSTEQTRDCQVTVNFQVPAGLAVSVTDFTYQGYVNLSLGATAGLTANYNWAGLGRAIEEGKSFVGPVDRSFLFVDSVRGASLSACGAPRPLLISTSGTVRTPSRNGSAYLNLQSLDAQTRTPLSLKFRFAARPC